MRFRSSLFGAFEPPTVAQASSCFVPPANPVSLFVACASSRPTNDQPAVVFADWRNGAVPVHVEVDRSLWSEVAVVVLEARSCSYRPAGRGHYEHQCRKSCKGHKQKPASPPAIRRPENTFRHA
jgi:hypothetical protein